ncbi:hypothetical protein E2C01_088363 [Portunus trituberculatus]|uniref:Uncharacterized protein n=1 Tax=Portunus trituberculatus TaxID=210409 RepID=A0A5B7J912_PORTR|nr:hypothetical protein [Portunus trituberculatus]
MSDSQTRVKAPLFVLFKVYSVVWRSDLKEESQKFTVAISDSHAHMSRLLSSCSSGFTQLCGEVS